MIKKAILAAGISLSCLAPVFAEEPATLSDRIDRVDEVIYGSAQSGSLISRVDNADNLIYGNGNSSASGLDNRITNLYTDVVKSDNDAQPSIATGAAAVSVSFTSLSAAALAVSVSAAAERTTRFRMTAFGAPLVSSSPLVVTASWVSM
jgi:hypothetical protein